MENSIEFRQRVFSERDSSNKPKVDYRLDLNTQHLIHVKTGRHLLYIKSECYKMVINQLQRLEHPNYIHISTHKDTPEEAMVELVRMNLKFKVVRSGEEFKLESNEFSGMRVSCEQNIGTLYGLNHGLILESIEQATSVQTKILLIPNGKVRPEYNEEEQLVLVDIHFKAGMKNPPFYKYEVDEVCKQLKSNDRSHASWFYLAYLHALTSHGEIEPFLGMSGTERALQILQSASAWSASPYEPDTINILKEIADLSPIRKLIGRTKIQSVTWPPNIPPRSAQDSFVIIANKLLADSQRLHELYLKKPTKGKIELSFNELEYHRCLQLQPNMRVNAEFIQPKVLRTSMSQAINFKFSKNTQLVSILYHTNRYQPPTNTKFLKHFLTHKRKTLQGLQNNYVDTISQLLYHEECYDFANIWINLYNVARKNECSDEKWSLVLSLLAHQDKELDPILALQAIAKNSDQFKDIKPPDVAEYNISRGHYSDEKASEKVKLLLTGHFSREHFTSATTKTTIIDDLASLIHKDWPCSSVEFSNPPRFEKHVNEFDHTAANVALNELLACWFARHELNTFIKKVQDRLKTLEDSTSRSLPEMPKYDPFDTLEPNNWPKFNIDVCTQILCKEQCVVNEARNIWKMNGNALVRSSSDWWAEIERILRPTGSTHMIQAGLFPRIVPSLLLPKIISARTDESLKGLIGTWAMAIVREQRQTRLDKYSKQPDRKPDLDCEIGNEPHVNWKPCERPEWLLFEIEQNLTIRKIQIDVADRMINPPTQGANDARHLAMQLNMGEGKTSVIIPMLAAVLANGSQVCQITVLKALFTTNLKSLRQYLGGMLNQRIYTLPCRRDLPFTENIQQIQEFLEECKVKKGR